jgi:hypothetical protein
MDLSQLKSLGEVAGIGGIALGGVVLLVRPLIATIVGLPKNARTGTVKLIAVGLLCDWGARRVVAWAIGSWFTVSTSGRVFANPTPFWSISLAIVRPADDRSAVRSPAFWPPVSSPLRWRQY